MSVWSMEFESTVEEVVTTFMSQVNTLVKLARTKLLTH